MADQQDPARPSFVSFWKRSKDVITGRTITFVPSGSNPNETSPDKHGDSTATALSDREKAQIRRAQVRKAQIQHRQRKDNYVKQLELDIARIRDLIAAAERETRSMRRENAAMHGRLKAAATPQQPVVAPPVTSPTPLFDDIDIDEIDDVDITMTLDIDEAMQAPCFQISSSPSASSFASGGTSSTIPELPDLTPEQTQEAINFILALEHICWDHFGHEDFEPDSPPQGLESGHTLMASSLALRGAPPSVFAAVGQTKANMEDALPPPQQQQAPLPSSYPVPGDVSWQTSGLTLQALHGLARSLNAADEDLTPVQAWFELAAAYPPERLLRPDVLAVLKREFVGVVKCPHYGAAIERTAFESVVARVLGNTHALADAVLVVRPAAA